VAQGEAAERAAGRLAFRSALVVTALLLVLSGALAGRAAPDGHVAPVLVDLATFLWRRQDLPVAALCVLGLVACYLMPLPDATPRWRVGTGTMIAVLLAVTLALWAARIWLLFDHDLSRDEQMVGFDQRIFASGRLFATLAEPFRATYQALNPMFTLPIGGHEGWVSAYLPVNAALRAGAGLILPDALVSALFVFVAGLALWQVARRLWPESGSTQLVVMLCFLGSSQVLLMGTTRYAMAPHLALNLLWLLLFLRRTWPGHVAAILVGFLATGLHQPLFHPLFVLPLLLLLVHDRAWRELAFYLAAYALIAAVWVAWPGWLSAQGATPVIVDATYEGVTFAERLRRVLHLPTATSFELMAANLARFLTWQFLLLVPLAIVGVRSAWRTPLVQALAAGILLLLVAMTLLLPAQGHGWGYRYLHGLIGNFALLAGYGWAALEKRRRAPVPALLAATLLSVFVLLPVHAWMARTILAPFAGVARGIDALDADLAVIDRRAVPFGMDLVSNRADLSNRPLRFSAGSLAPAALVRLCRDRKVAFVRGPAMAGIAGYFDVPLDPRPTRELRRLHEAAVASGCRVQDVTRF
jgi:hypothetical protein